MTNGYLGTILTLLLVSFSAPECIVKKFSDVEQAISTCKDITLDNFTVPAGKTLNLHLLDGARVTFKGHIYFGFKHWLGPLVAIGGNNITVNGELGSVLDGQGEQYWDGQGGWSNEKPQFLTVKANHSVLRNIQILNAPQGAVEVNNSNHVIFDKWIIDDYNGDPGVAPTGHEGHNTDGFDVWNSTNIVINNTAIFNQDDCVAVRFASNVSVSNMYCQGSHGLSISVGFSNESSALNMVLNVSFTDSVMQGGRNGIHIKTHVDGGYGNITGVIYRNITMKDITHYGILIEENYSNQPPGSNHTSPEPTNNIPIRNLVLDDVTGSVLDSAVPIQIVCADEGCFDWRWSGVNVTGSQSSNCNYQPGGFQC